jgi:nitrogen fixation/metabolism regulation signal transduction histidine kinase
MSPTLLIVLIIAIVVALAGVFMRRRPESPGRRRMLWLIGIAGGLVIVLALLALLAR